MTRQEIIDAILEEYDQAEARFGAYNSAHEGYAVLKEEVDELWDEIKLKEHLRLPYKLQREAIQVAAVAMRFLTHGIQCPADNETKHPQGLGQ